MTWGKGDPRTTTPEWRKLRLTILKRDRYTCQRCGAPANEVDHVHNVAAGGIDHPTNLVAVCQQCHRRKTAREGADARWKHHPTRRPTPKHPGLR